MPPKEFGFSRRGHTLSAMLEDRAGTYLVTSITYERRPLFRAHKTAELFLDTLQHYRREGRYKLHAFVVMPNHIHLLITPQGTTLERAMQLIKGGFSHRLGSKFPVWQKSYKDHRCRDANEFIARKDYVHMNPVRARLVSEQWQYRFSSAYRADMPSAAEAEHKKATLMSRLKP